ncbi:sporulation membrane protein YtrI [Bacillus sp. CGMCC 1.16607]|uniref:sporulation membrane protein YtrI n=1 Tax=Bacillus sp. CGMCC 1.16607 TaxID=3351842 RepID=UPI003634BA6F
MRIPTWQIWKRWRRFFTGMAVGGIVSWSIFVFIYGVWQEKQTKLIHEQEENIKDYKTEKLIWQAEFQALNKKNQEKMTIQSIKMKIRNAEKYRLDLFSVYQVEESVKEDLNIMLAKDLETVYKSRDLLKKVIENKVVKINGKRYRLEVKEVYIYTTLNIQLDIHLEN